MLDLLGTTGKLPMLYDAFTINFPSLASLIALPIVEIVSSSATLMLNFKTTSNIRLPHLKHKIDIQKNINFSKN